MTTNTKNIANKGAKAKAKAKAGVASILFSITKWTYWSVMMILTLLLCLLLICSAFSDHVNPLQLIYPAFLGISFGISAIIGLVWFCILLILHRWKCAIILLITFLIISEPLTRIFPIQIFGLPKPEINEITVDGKTSVIAPDTIRLLTYNTCSMGQTHLSQIKEKIPIIDFIRESKADIVCLQEYAFTLSKDGHTQQELRSRLSDLYPYYDYTPNKGMQATGIAIFSKFPIRKGTRIDKNKDDYFSAMYYQLEAYGQRIGVINMHLHSNSIQTEDRILYKEMIDHFEKDSIPRIRTNMLRPLAKAFRSRASEAIAIRKFLEETHPSDMPLMICGDMNDTPVSFCYHTLKKDLNDTWQNAGRGNGITYREYRLWFRIDHIFYSDHLKALDVAVRKDILYSDHYPVQATYQLLKHDH